MDSVQGVGVWGGVVPLDSVQGVGVGWGCGSFGQCTGGRGGGLVPLYSVHETSSCVVFCWISEPYPVPENVDLTEPNNYQIGECSDKVFFWSTSVNPSYQIGECSDNVLFNSSANPSCQTSECSEKVFFSSSAFPS